MTAFDGFLNTIVPIAIVILFLFILGKAMSKPLRELFEWIRGMFSSKKEEVFQSGGLGYE